MLFAVALAVLVLAPSGVSDGDVIEGSQSTLAVPSGESYVAAGTCGDGVYWTYSSSDAVLMIEGEGTLARYDEDRWGAWTMTSLRIDGTEVDGGSLARYVPGDIIGSVGELVLCGPSLRVPEGILDDLSPSSASFTDGFAVITEGMFSGCTRLGHVDLDGIVEIRDRAFSGCSRLAAVDVRTVSSLSLTAFERCISLSSLSATGSSVFTSEDGILYSDGGSTLYMCPPAHAREVIELPSRVTAVNLDYADVVYAYDAMNGSVSFSEAVEGAEARGLVFSSLGMSSHSLSRNGDSVTLSYELFDGWAVVPSCLTSEGLEAEIGSGFVSLTLSSRVSSVYPMGVAVLIYEMLAAVTVAGEWVVTLPEVDGTGVIEDIGELSATVIGYAGTDGTGELGARMYLHGIVCEVSSVSMDPALASGLEELTVGEGVEMGPGAFGYVRSLRTVTADHVSAVGEDAFRYCTGLTSVSLASCTDIGDRAFDGCWSLEELLLGDVASVSFGDSALRSCNSLELVVVGYSTEVSGDADVTVVHCTEDSFDISFGVSGGYLVVDAQFSSRVAYETADGGGVALCYRDRALIPMDDEIWLIVTHGTGGTGLQVIFDPGMGLDPTTRIIQYGSTVGGMEDPSVWGYRFLYWSLDGERFDMSQAMTESAVLVGVWVKEDSQDPTPVYLLATFVVAIVATMAVLAAARRRLR